MIELVTALVGKLQGLEKTDKMGAADAALSGEFRDMANPLESVVPAAMQGNGPPLQTPTAFLSMGVPHHAVLPWGPPDAVPLSPDLVSFIDSPIEDKAAVDTLVQEQTMAPVQEPQAVAALLLTTADAPAPGHAKISAVEILAPGRPSGASAPIGSDFADVSHPKAAVPPTPTVSDVTQNTVPLSDGARATDAPQGLAGVASQVLNRSIPVEIKPGVAVVASGQETPGPSAGKALAQGQVLPASVQTDAIATANGSSQGIMGVSADKARAAGQVSSAQAAYPKSGRAPVAEQSAGDVVKAPASDVSVVPASGRLASPEPENSKRYVSGALSSSPTPPSDPKTLSTATKIEAVLPRSRPSTEPAGTGQTGLAPAVDVDSTPRIRLSEAVNETARTPEQSAQIVSPNTPFAAREHVPTATPVVAGQPVASSAPGPIAGRNLTSIEPGARQTERAISQPARGAETLAADPRADAARDLSLSSSGPVQNSPPARVDLPAATGSGPLRAAPVDIQKGAMGTLPPADHPTFGGQRIAQADRPAMYEHTGAPSPGLEPGRTLTQKRDVSIAPTPAGAPQSLPEKAVDQVLEAVRFVAAKPTELETIAPLPSRLDPMTMKVRNGLGSGIATSGLDLRLRQNVEVQRQPSASTSPLQPLTDAVKMTAPQGLPSESSAPLVQPSPGAHTAPVGAVPQAPSPTHAMHANVTTPPPSEVPPEGFTPRETGDPARGSRDVRSASQDDLPPAPPASVQQAGPNSGAQAGISPPAQPAPLARGETSAHDRVPLDRPISAPAAAPQARPQQTAAATAKPRPDIGAASLSFGTDSVELSTVPVDLEARDMPILDEMGHVQRLDFIGQSSAPIRAVLGAPAAPLPGPIAQKALQQVAAAARTDRFPIEIALDPPELGNVRMLMQSGETGTTLLILADRPETLDLMRRNASLLEQSFGQEGQGSLDLQFGTSEQSFGAGGDAEDAGAPARRDVAGASEDLAGPLDLPTNRTRGLTPTGGLDLTL